MVYKFRRYVITAWRGRYAAPNAISVTGISPSPRAAFTTHWLWLLTVFSVAGFFEAVFWGQLLTFTPLYLPVVGVAPGQVKAWLGWIAVFGGLLGVPFVPFWGALADQYGYKPLIVRAYVALLIGALFTLLAPSAWFVTLGRAATSLALGSSGLMMAALAERAPARRIGVAFAIMNSTGPIGAFLGPMLGGPVVDAWGMRSLLVIDCGLLIACIAGLLWGYQGNRPAPLPATRSLWRMALDSLRFIGQSPRLRLLFPALFLLFTGWMLATTYIPLLVPTFYQGERLGFTIGLVVGAGGLLAMVIAPLLGALGDRYGCWRVLILAASVTVILWLLPALTSTLLSFGAAWALLNGLSSAVFALSFTVLADAIAPEMRGRIMSFSYLPLLFANMFGPALGALITRQSLFVIFPVAALITALGVGAVIWAAGKDVLPRCASTRSGA